MYATWAFTDWLEDMMWKFIIYVFQKKFCPKLVVNFFWFKKLYLGKKRFISTIINDFISC